MKYAAFLRAINVGGHIVKMDRLRAVFEAAGFRGAETFIASGNVVFESSRKSAGDLERAIETDLKKALGYPVATFVRSMPELAAIVNLEPFGPESLKPPDSVFVGFLRSAVSKDARRQFASLSNDVDTVMADGREIYWRARKGFAESTISYAVVEKLLKTEATFRNLNTVKRMAASTVARNRLVHESLNAALIAVGVMSAGMGLKGFLLSSGFIDGGVTGISMLLAKTTGVPLSVCCRPSICRSSSSATGCSAAPSPSAACSASPDWRGCSRPCHFPM